MFKSNHSWFVFYIKNPNKPERWMVIYLKVTKIFCPLSKRTRNKTKYSHITSTPTSAQVRKKTIPIYTGYEGHQCMILGCLYFGLNVLWNLSLTLSFKAPQCLVTVCCTPAPSHPNLRRHKGKKECLRLLQSTLSNLI